MSSLAVLFVGLTLQPLCGQDGPIFLRSICTKVQPGKGPELEDLLSKNAIKASEYNIKQGKLLRYVVLRNVYPGGTSAECDYISSFFYSGPPPETNTESTTAAWAAAKTGLTYPGFLAKLNTIGHTVRIDVYVSIARTGSAQVGDYVSLNHMQVHDNAAWSELESKIWKPIQQARIKDNQMRAWGSYVRVLPSGSGLPYSAQTADIYPSWDVLWKQKSIFEYVKQAHPNMSNEEFSEKTSKARDLVSREIFKLVMAVGSLAR